MGITSYPSFIFYDHGVAGELNDCTGCRSEGGIIKYVKDHSNIPLISPLDCAGMIFQMANAELAVGYIGSKTGDDTLAWDEFEKAS